MVAHRAGTGPAPTKYMVKGKPSYFANYLLLAQAGFQVLGRREFIPRSLGMVWARKP